MSTEPQANPQNTGAVPPLIGNCFACNGLVKVPATASARDDVRCPHCGKIFPLAHLLEQVVPELEVVEGSESPKSAHEEVRPARLDDFVVPKQLAKNAFRKKRSRESEKTEKGFKPVREAQESDTEAVVVDTSTGSKPTEKPSRSGRRKSKRRSRKKSSRERGGIGNQVNPIGEAIKIGLGAVLAIPIAYLIVIWVFGQDPLNVGPSIGRSVPSLVPAKYRESANDDGSESTGSKSDADSDESVLPTLDANEGLPETNEFDGASGRLAVPKIDPDLLGRDPRDDQ